MLTNHLVKADNKLLMQNFKTKFDFEFQCLQPKGNLIDYLKFSKLLFKLKCLKEFNQSKQSSKTKELWSILGGDSKLSKNVIFNALCDILLISNNEFKEDSKLHKEFYEFYERYIKVNYDEINHCKPLCGNLRNYNSKTKQNVI